MRISGQERTDEAVRVERPTRGTAMALWLASSYLEHSAPFDSADRAEHQAEAHTRVEPPRMNLASQLDDRDKPPRGATVGKQRGA